MNKQLMTVGDLIKVLKKYPKHTRLLARNSYLGVSTEVCFNTESEMIVFYGGVTAVPKHLEVLGRIE